MQQLLLFRIQEQWRLLQGDKTFTRAKADSFYLDGAHPDSQRVAFSLYPVDAKRMQDQLVAELQLLWLDHNLVGVKDTWVVGDAPVLVTN